MTNHFDGLGLRQLKGVINVAVGVQLECICADNARLYSFFKENAHSGYVNRSTFGLHQLPELMPNICLLDIKPPPTSNIEPVGADHLFLTYMGSGLDQIYGTPDWQSLADYRNQPVAKAITESVNHVRATANIISGGTLFETDFGLLLLQATFMPIGPEDGPIDRVLCFTKRMQRDEYEAVGHRLESGRQL